MTEYVGVQIFHEYLRIATLRIATFSVSGTDNLAGVSRKDLNRYTRCDSVSEKNN